MRNSNKSIMSANAIRRPTLCCKTFTKYLKYNFNFDDGIWHAPLSFRMLYRLSDRQDSRRFEESRESICHHNCIWYNVTSPYLASVRRINNDSTQDISKQAADNVGLKCCDCYEIAMKKEKKIYIYPCFVNDLIRYFPMSIAIWIYNNINALR